MSPITLFLIALGLSMDAFAVSVTNGMCITSKRNRPMLFLSAGMFGLFQGLMPMVGYILGNTFIDYISAFDHWIAFILLGLIGGKMIVEAVRRKKEDAAAPSAESYTFRLVVLQAIATSIDALTVGISFAVLSVNIVVASSFIAVVTFVLCLIGIALGRVFGNLFQKQAEIFGGVILILIGLKILLEHLTA